MRYYIKRDSWLVISPVTLLIVERGYCKGYLALYRFHSYCLLHPFLWWWNYRIFLLNGIRPPRQPQGTDSQNQLYRCKELNYMWKISPVHQNYQGIYSHPSILSIIWITAVNLLRNNLFFTNHEKSCEKEKRIWEIRTINSANSTL